MGVHDIELHLGILLFRYCIEHQLVFVHRCVQKANKQILLSDHRPLINGSLCRLSLTQFAPMDDTIATLALVPGVYVFDEAAHHCWFATRNTSAHGPYAFYPDRDPLVFHRLCT